MSIRELVQGLTARAGKLIHKGHEEAAAPGDRPAEIGIAQGLALLDENVLPAGLMLCGADDGRIVVAAGFLKERFERGEIKLASDVVPASARKRQTVYYNGGVYAVHTREFTAEGTAYHSVLLSGEQRGATPETAMGLIIVDNYDEAMDSTEDVRRPILTALIDRKLGALAQQVGGVCRKFERDRYIFVFSFERLEALQSKRFDILKQVRETDVGNKLPVTLSIGIGVGGSSLEANMGYAHAAIDLALGRGGDQAVIKDPDGYNFFGGRSREAGRNARVRARVKAYAFTELIQGADNVIVLGHKNIDLDCYGAAIGVYKIVTALGRGCNIVLGGISSSIGALHERMIKEPGYDAAFISGGEAAARMTDKTLVVVVDTHRPSLIEGGELLAKAESRNIIVFDHHRKAAEFIESPVLTYHEPFASSTCELITEMLQYTRAEIQLKPVEADALLAGITVDTKNFTLKTGAGTFDAAAYLRRRGADSVRVKRYMKNGMEAFKAKAAAAASAEIYSGSMALAVSPEDIENPPLTAAQTADDLLGITGIEASFVLCRADGVVYISARSLGRVNVQLIMERLGGGGHQSSAGAQLEDMEEREAMVRLKGAIDAYGTVQK